MRKYPEIPKTIQGLAGDIRIFRVAKKRGELWGLWTPEDREIEVNARLRLGQVIWHTLLHELAHAAHGDSGLDPQLDTPLIEPLVDATASQMLHVVDYLIDHYEKLLEEERENTRC